MATAAALLLLLLAAAACAAHACTEAADLGCRTGGGLMAARAAAGDGSRGACARACAVMAFGVAGLQRWLRIYSGCSVLSLWAHGK